MSLDFSHGGDIAGAKEQFGFNESDFLDFSSNINGVGYPDIIKDIVMESLQTINKYPDNKCRKLRNAIASYVGVDFEKIIPGNGAMELLRVVMEMPEIKRILIIGPTFVEYEKLAMINGKEYTYYELKKDGEFDFVPDDVLEKSHGIDAIFICNPNNPTSRLYDKNKMLGLAQKCREMGITLVIDETFIELTIDGNANSLVKEVDNFDNLIIVRAATKYFAIPGVRLGYVVVSEKFIKYFWNKKATWSVNTFAANAGEIFLNEADYRKKTLKWMSSEIDYLYNELNKFNGFKVYKPSSIFILLEILEENLTSDKLFEMMGRKGILIRNAKNFKFLDNTFVRIAVKDRQSNNCLLNALKEYIGSI